MLTNHSPSTCPTVRQDTARCVYSCGRVDDDKPRCTPRTGPGLRRSALTRNLEWMTLPQAVIENGLRERGYRSNTAHVVQVNVLQACRHETCMHLSKKIMPVACPSPSVSKRYTAVRSARVDGYIGDHQFALLCLVILHGVLVLHCGQMGQNSLEFNTLDKSTSPILKWISSSRTKSQSTFENLNSNVAQLFR